MTETNLCYHREYDYILLYSYIYSHYAEQANQKQSVVSSIGNKTLKDQPLGH
jgi:hypothetical protein